MKSTFFIVLSALVLVAGTPLAMAQVPDDVVCAMVLPCDEQGQVLPAYRGSPCEPMYATQCAALKESQAQEALSECQTKKGTMEKKIQKLARKVRHLKRSVRTK